jgi:hypothetical protein
VLADVFFRRVDGNIEVAWDNRFFSDKQVYFTKPVGIYVVPRKVFKNAIFGFLNDILSKLENDVGRNAKIGDCSIGDLRRKADFLV